MRLTDRQRDLNGTSRWEFDDLGALYVNCTLRARSRRSAPA